MICFTFIEPILQMYLLGGMEELTIINPVMRGFWASQVAPVVKNLPTNTGDVRDTDSIPELGRCSGGRHGNPL